MVDELLRTIATCNSLCNIQKATIDFEGVLLYLTASDGTKKMPSLEEFYQLSRIETCSDLTTYDKWPPVTNAGLLTVQLYEQRYETIHFMMSLLTKPRSPIAL